MAVILNVEDGTGVKHVLRSEGNNPNLIGFHYQLDGVRVKTLKDSQCETYLHYLSTPGAGRIKQEPIPANTVLLAEYYWRNFYGAYFRVKYNNKPYDISVNNVKIL